MHLLKDLLKIIWGHIPVWFILFAVPPILFEKDRKPLWLEFPCKQFGTHNYVSLYLFSLCFPFLFVTREVTEIVLEGRRFRRLVEI